MTAMQTRILTALILGPLFIGAIYIGGWFFVAVLAAVAALAHWEYTALVKSPWAMALGILYIGIPTLSLVWLRQQEMAAALLVILSVWMTDICAMFAGKKFGGRKLAPTISPNKTWSGLIGGIIGSAIVVAGVAGYYAPAVIPVYLLVGAVLAVIAQAGDLFESYMKRCAGVKDSGTIIPGHGGVLDRIDGLLTAAPCFALFIWLMA